MDYRIEHRDGFAVPVKVCPPKPAMDYTQGVLPTYLSELAPDVDTSIVRHGVEAQEWGRFELK